MKLKITIEAECDVEGRLDGFVLSAKSSSRKGPMLKKSFVYYDLDKHAGKMFRDIFDLRSIPLRAVHREALRG